MSQPVKCHGLPTAVSVTRSMVSAVRHAHSKYSSYLENERQKTAAEAAHKNEPSQTAERMQIARKKQKI